MCSAVLLQRKMKRIVRIEVVPALFGAPEVVITSSDPPARRSRASRARRASTP